MSRRRPGGTGRRTARLRADPSVAHTICTRPCVRSHAKVGQRYVAAFNRKHGRTGTLWEGRFKSCLVDSEHYLLTVHRYIELNPVRAAMVTAPEHYRWSSVHASLMTLADPIITSHEVYLACSGTHPVQRAASYREWLRQGINDDELHAVRAHLQQERALGNPGFRPWWKRPSIVR